ncbi:hypothetical protein EJ05DRAFT_504885 [Pseudovirgaria hyperparasitica]|uniref:Uncharacterized protein n=1 Tax=Pseudovirgaria hyperparasitica TaxID=470096 RepID=A0A6A6VX23_9PEZI|nr:uncharacterized protein EJ05DRAFT_504885 [Pseudovirgaria hyperparasitica]KAF2753807.1 hypothetical protein EJ05DRAFT_504885 [Pseudovirgaria hyperparasitica]
MLLTLQKPAKADFEYKHPHEYSPPLPYSSRFSPKPAGGILRPLSVSARRESPTSMSNPHRGLPPPAAMQLADPGRGPPPMQLADPGRGPPPPPPPSMPQSLGSMPAPPPQWQGAEEPMKNWLAAKAEEEKRKQEEEKTKQERLRLEQRQIEQQMLRDSFQGGVPPHMVPVIFAGIGGGNLANMSMEWLQQYMSQVQGTVQPQQVSQGQMSPDARREPPRLLNPPPHGSVYGSQQSLPMAPGVQGQPLSAVPPPHGGFAQSTYARGSQSPQTRTRASTISGGQTGTLHSAPRAPTQSSLPRLTTNEMQVQQPPPSSMHQQQHPPQQPPQEQTSSPSIYFHHWVPPTSQPSSSSRDPPATPSDHTTSPKKRKAQGPHPFVPPPTSAPQYTSPPFSHDSSSASTPARRGHVRTRSDTSTRALEAVRPRSRHGMHPVYGYAEAERGGSRVPERYESRPAPERYESRPGPERLDESPARRESGNREARDSREGYRASHTSTPVRAGYPPPPPTTTRSPKREETQ